MRAIVSDAQSSMAPNPVSNWRIDPVERQSTPELTLLRSALRQANAFDAPSCIKKLPNYWLRTQSSAVSQIGMTRLPRLRSGNEGIEHAIIRNTTNYRNQPAF